MDDTEFERGENRLFNENVIGGSWRKSEGHF